jgi:hypothetical protein
MQNLNFFLFRFDHYLSEKIKGLLMSYIQVYRTFLTEMTVVNFGSIYFLEPFKKFDILNENKKRSYGMNRAR